MVAVLEALALMISGVSLSMGTCFTALAFRQKYQSRQVNGQISVFLGIFCTLPADGRVVTDTDNQLKGVFI